MSPHVGRQIVKSRISGTDKQDKRMPVSASRHRGWVRQKLLSKQKKENQIRLVLGGKNVCKKKRSKLILLLTYVDGRKIKWAPRTVHRSEKYTGIICPHNPE